MTQASTASELVLNMLAMSVGKLLDAPKLSCVQLVDSPSAVVAGGKGSTGVLRFDAILLAFAAVVASTDVTELLEVVRSNTQYMEVSLAMGIRLLVALKVDKMGGPVFEVPGRGAMVETQGSKHQPCHRLTHTGPSTCWLRKSDWGDVIE